MNHENHSLVECHSLTTNIFRSEFKKMSTISMAPALARMLEPVHLEAAGTKNLEGWVPEGT